VSWFRIAAELIRGAMGAGDSQPSPPKSEGPPPEDISGLVDLIDQHRAEVNRGFDAVSQMIQAQNQRHQQALRLQRRWNYGLLAGLIAVALTIVVLYWRVTS
jgi:hypothetical protein